MLTALATRRLTRVQAADIETSIGELLVAESSCHGTIDAAATVHGFDGDIAGLMKFLKRRAEQ